MQTLYDWLLYNTENAGNYYTILNTKRDEAGGINIMARSSDFEIVQLLIRDLTHSESTDNPSANDSEPKYVFTDEQQVITYLAEGKTPESGQANEEAGIQVFITEPGNSTFPSDQA